jgi:hypothetical protein
MEKKWWMKGRRADEEGGNQGECGVSRRPKRVLTTFTQSVTLAYPSPSCMYVCMYLCGVQCTTVTFYNMVRSLASCCAAFSPHSHTTTSCASLLVSHPHLFHISTTSTTTLLFFSRWNINLLTLKLYYLSTCI